MKTMEQGPARHTIVSRDEWDAARIELLMKEKELTRLRDRLSAERRELPWVKVGKDYVFDTPEGKLVYSGDISTASQGYYQIPTPRVLPGTEGHASPRLHARVETALRLLEWRSVRSVPGGGR